MEATQTPLDPLDELEELMAESKLLSPQRKDGSIRNFNDERTKIELTILQIKARELEMERLYTISMWEQAECQCGTLGARVFVRFLEKSKQVRGSLVHWREVEAPLLSIPVQYYAALRPVKGCEACMKYVEGGVQSDELELQFRKTRTLIVHEEEV
jgi:hypothetical protein